MSISDPIADMLTRIRNALVVGHTTVSIPKSNLKVAIAQILEEEGFIDGFEVSEGDGSSKASIRVNLKYVGERRSRRPVITNLKRVSKPGRRVYVGKSEIPWVQSGIGIAILSTPQGVMTGIRARQLGIGGEVLCQVW
jgi:small subunit ribosomal protein S8